MIKKTYICDRCGEQIAEGTVYSLTCYADDVVPGLGQSPETSAQNTAQNAASMNRQTRHLCKACKDALTDGIFIV